MTDALPPASMRASDMPLSADFEDLLASDRVNERLRSVLVRRGKPGPVRETPPALDDRDLAVLRTIVRRIVPQPDGAPDLAAVIGERLASGRGYGWRYDVLPVDAEAYRLALQALDGIAMRQHGRSIADLDGEDIDALLRGIQEETVAIEPGTALDPRAFARWFEDVRADAVRAYMALPTTLDRIGFSGIGAGGDGPALRGFTRFGIGIEEAWEPRAHRGDPQIALRDRLREGDVS